MKIRLERLLVTLGGLVAFAGAGAVAMVGCSGDDTTATTQDGAVSDVTNGDVARPDAPGPDAGPGQDADAQAEAAPPPPLAGFPTAVQTAFCQRLAECCLSPQTFDLAKCIATEANPAAGGFLNLSTWTPALDGGNVTYNPAAASACIAEVRNIACGLIMQATYGKYTTDCYAALSGTLDAGAQGCRYAIECAPGTYCDKSGGGDAGGKCAPVHDAGAPCTDPMSTDCSYLGNGVPARFCDFSGGAGGVCNPQLGLDAGCNYGSDCTSLICGDLGTCDTQFVFSDPGVPQGSCDYFTIRDAGDGGG